MEQIRSADELVAAMLVAGDDGRPRDVYEAHEGGSVPTGRFLLTYGRGRTVAPAAVKEAIRRGLIKPSYPDTRAGSWSLPAQAEDNRRLLEAYAARHAGRKGTG